MPAGYRKADGTTYRSRGAFSYGWTTPNGTGKDRNSALSPDQRYDTLVHMQKPANPNAVFELAVSAAPRPRPAAGSRARLPSPSATAA